MFIARNAMHLLMQKLSEISSPKLARDNLRKKIKSKHAKKKNTEVVTVLDGNYVLYVTKKYPAQSLNDCVEIPLYGFTYLPSNEKFEMEM